MNDRVCWIDYRGKKILKIDYSGLRGDAIVEVIDQIIGHYAGQLPGTVLTLSDVRNAHADEKCMAKLKDNTRKTRHFDKKAAVVGVSGIKGILLSAVNVFAGHSVKAFHEEKEALDWLVS